VRYVKLTAAIHFLSDELARPFVISFGFSVVGIIVGVAAGCCLWPVSTLYVVPCLVVAAACYKSRTWLTPLIATLTFNSIEFAGMSFTNRPLYPSPIERFLDGGRHHAFSLLTELVVGIAVVVYFKRKANPRPPAA